MSTTALMVTGHRPQHLVPGQSDWICSELRRVIDKVQPDVAISGLALGVDTWFATTVLDYPCDLYAYCPGPWQADRWPIPDQTVWANLRSMAAKVFDESPQYHPGAFHARNQAMVNHASEAIVVWNGKRSGGTYDALRRIHLAGHPFIHIRPDGSPTTRIHPV